MATLTVFPDASSGSTTVDGYVRRGGSNEAWSTIRAGAGQTTNTTSTGSSDYWAQLSASSTSNLFNALVRGFATFDTSALGSSATISSAILSLWGFDKRSAMGVTSVHVAGATMSSNNNLATADFANVARTSFGSLTISGMSTTAYNDITLNSSGITNISKTGITNFSTQLDVDINNTTPTWVSFDSTYVAFRFADQTGTTNDPKLTITYTTSAGRTVIGSGRTVISSRTAISSRTVVSSRTVI